MDSRYPLEQNGLNQLRIPETSENKVSISSLVSHKNSKNFDSEESK